MSKAERMHFLLDVFQMTAIVTVSEINHYHINGLHLFEYTLYISEKQGCLAFLKEKKNTEFKVK